MESKQVKLNFISENEGGEAIPNIMEQQVALYDSVKSSAVVKFSNMECPSTMEYLLPNTNLNEPPANWLHGGSKWQNFLRDVSLGKEHSFSSFKMAHCVPDVVGDIDVISDAENIKKLLKIPYSKSQVSMMVHRVGNTILLDEFDIHKFLLRKEQEEWRWMRKFYEETVLQDVQEKHILTKSNKSRESLQNRNMFSKFLYYSIPVGEEACLEGSLQSEVGSNQGPLESAGSSLLHCVPDVIPQIDHSEHWRTVQWIFEDIHMLIGTDLPIFGGGTHPCVSLRLRDAKKPISVLTGLDFWLDNLMCNVPEVAMCYHDNGIVKKYEVLNTEDIPNLENSKFYPNVIKDVAQNILSFLKSNATQEGHTYWLFRGNGDDIVKLYDLTTLCSDWMEDRTDNPFTVPVGILLYRVARNMRQNVGRQKSGTVRTLLENCLVLLDKEIHSQIVTSAHYLLSDLFITDDIYNLNVLPGSAYESEDENEQHCSSEDDSEGESCSSSVAVNALCQPQAPPPAMKELVRYPPITGGVEDRCREALKHISQGLQCLDQNVTLKNSPKKHTVEQQAMCDPDEAIPLDYSPIKGKQSGFNGTESTSGNQISLLREYTLPSGSWHRSSKALLLRKAVIAYYGLAQAQIQTHGFGQALKYVRLSLMCFSAVQKLLPNKAEENLHLFVETLGLAGDIQVNLKYCSAKLSEHIEAFSTMSEEDQYIEESANKELTGGFEYEWVHQQSNIGQKCLCSSVQIYELALEHISKCNPQATDVNGTFLKERREKLQLRLANAKNELGAWYMDQAARKIADSGTFDDTNKELCDMSLGHINCALELFTKMNDRVNCALLLANKAKLMRIYSQGAMQVKNQIENSPREFSHKEKQYYKKAQEYYQQALTKLGSRKGSPEIWDSVRWQLSTTYFTMATQIQEHAPLSTQSQEQVRKEVKSAMNKALEYCDADLGTNQQVTCQYRAATIHHKLASLYHDALRNEPVDSIKKELRVLAEKHYEQAHSYFKLVDSHCELLRLQLERAAMVELALQSQTSPNTKMKTLHCVLGYLLECEKALDLILNTVIEGDSSDFEAYSEEVMKLLPIFHSRLQAVTCNLVKNANLAKKGKHNQGQKPFETYKTMYETVLRLLSKPDADLSNQCKQLLMVVKQLTLLYQRPDT